MQPEIILYFTFIKINVKLVIMIGIGKNTESFLFFNK